jgi:hypothetical protein
MSLFVGGKSENKNFHCRSANIHSLFQIDRATTSHQRFVDSSIMVGSLKNAFATMMAARKSGDQTATKRVASGKKGKQQRKIKAYYPPKKNHQGFPMKECKFQPTEGAYMYRPWWYGRSYTNDPDNEGVYPTYCRHCKLQPCLTVEEKHHMSGSGKHLMDNDKKKPAQVRLIIANRLEMQRRRIFQLDFGAPPSHTQCTTDFVNLWFPDAQRQDF